jgi:serine/threonine-protein kinase RsbW
MRRRRSAEARRGGDHRQTSTSRSVRSPIAGGNILCFPTVSMLETDRDPMSTSPWKTPVEIMNQRLDSKLASIDVAESAALDLAGRAGFTGPSLARIGLAVREITANAILHGNRYDPAKKVFLTVSRTPSRLEVTISDQGSGFDLDSVADPRSPEGLLRPSGRGLYLAREFMDELHVWRGDLCGVTVVLVKHVNGLAHQDALSA